MKINQTHGSAKPNAHAAVATAWIRKPNTDMSKIESKPEQLAAARRYLAHLGGAVKGPCKARTHTGAALKRYWQAVRDGKIQRKGYKPKEVDK